VRQGYPRVSAKDVEMMSMEPRFDSRKADPAALKAMLGLQAYVERSGLDATLVRLVEIRASQINRCGF
jgi:alkylhydroperoxidase family enzyme